MNVIPVVSSQIASVAYDMSAHEFYVMFNNLNVYRYSDVSPEEVCSVLFADSIGKMFNAVIKNRKPYEKLDEMPEWL